MKKKSIAKTEPEPLPDLVWQRASYHFHTYAYRDPRSAFASGAALPVVSPTTVLLGLVSTLFSVGDSEHARQLLAVAHQCEVLVDAPDGVIFFRAFHQLRRYETLKYDKANPRFGLTKINQGTREYGLVDGLMSIYVGVPEELAEAAKIALGNLRHLGTHDSLCSLAADVESCAKPEAERVLYMPSEDAFKALHEHLWKVLEDGLTMITLSRFSSEKPIQSTLNHWHLVGGADTEILTYAIPGGFQGTTRGKIYRKSKTK